MRIKYKYDSYSREYLVSHLEKLEQEHKAYESILCTCEDDGSVASKLNAICDIIGCVEELIAVQDYSREFEEIGEDE